MLAQQPTQEILFKNEPLLMRKYTQNAGIYRNLKLIFSPVMWMSIEMTFMVLMLIAQIILLTQNDPYSIGIKIVENVRLFGAQFSISVGYIVVYINLNRSFNSLILTLSDDKSKAAQNILPEIKTFAK